MRLVASFSAVSVATLAWSAALLAQSTGNPWRAMAEKDAQAALELIERNHPGADPSLADSTFLKRLQTARSHVEERLAKVDSYPAYDALISGLAADFRDGHIWSTPLVTYRFRAWTGIILSRRGGDWVVGAQDQGSNEADLEGHKLVSCDGVAADEWSKERIGLFKGNPDVEAQLANNAAWLLLRDGNPFLKRPESCVFESPSGERQQVDLKWRQAELTELEPVIERAQGKRPAAGMGVSSIPGGYWIHLESLDNSAAQVAREVEKLQSELQRARVVVVDLRGNRGGDSSHATEIARALVGDQRLASAARPSTECKGAFWRVSQGNLETLREWRDRLTEGDAGSFAYVAGLVEDMETGLAEGRAFAPQLPECARDAGPTTQHVSETMQIPATIGRFVLVTDRSCFSSCLIAAGLFRRLGALHVGEATDISTRYMEARQALLPSGIRTFSTLQKVALATEDYGPYEPDIRYPSDLAATEELQQWVLGLPRVAPPTKEIQLD